MTARHSFLQRFWASQGSNSLTTASILRSMSSSWTCDAWEFWTLAKYSAADAWQLIRSRGPRGDHWASCTVAVQFNVMPDASPQPERNKATRNASEWGTGFYLYQGYQRTRSHDAFACQHLVWQSTSPSSSIFLIFHMDASQYWWYLRKFLDSLNRSSLAYGSETDWRMSWEGVVKSLLPKIDARKFRFRQNFGSTLLLPFLHCYLWSKNEQGWASIWLVYW